MLEVITSQLEDYQNRKLKQFQLANEKEDRYAIVFTGDSIIEYYLIRKYLGRHKHLINRGIAGTYTEWLINHIDVQVTDLLPEKVFIQIGTNDIGLGFSEKDIVNHIKTVIDIIKEKIPDTEIFLLSLAPVSELEEFSKTVKVRTNTVIDQINLQLSSIVGAEYIDVNTTLKDNSNQLKKEFTVDGLHLSPQGYQQISEIIKEKIE